MRMSLVLPVLLLILCGGLAADSKGSRNPPRHSKWRLSKTPTTTNEAEDTIIDLTVNPFTRLVYGGLNMIYRFGSTIGESLGMRALLQRGLEGFLEKSFGPIWLNSLKKLVKIGEKLADLSEGRSRNVRKSLDLLRYGMKQLKAFKDGQIEAPEYDNCTVTDIVMRGARSLTRLFSMSKSDVTERGYHGGGGGYHATYGTTFAGLDPLALLSGLAFLAFLLQALLALLMRNNMNNTNTNTTRSLDVMGLHLPLQKTQLDSQELVKNVLVGVENYHALNQRQSRRLKKRSLEQDAIWK